MPTTVSIHAQTNNLKLVELGELDQIRLEVSKSDIKNGIPGDPEKCALALCARRQVPGLRKVHFFGSVTYLEKRYPKNKGRWKGELIRCKNTEAVRKWVAVFDVAKAISKPETLILVGFPATQTLEAVTKRMKENAKRKGLTRNSSTGKTNIKKAAKTTDVPSHHRLRAIRF